MPRLQSRAAIDRPETTKLPSIPEVFWQQLQETHISDMYRNSSTNVNKSTHTPEFKPKNVVKSQTSPKKETSPEVSGSNKEYFLENQTRNTPVQCINDSKKQQPENQGNETDMSPPKISTLQIEERPVRDDITNELYMPLSSTIVPK